jgi:tetratricopeptide (TPR) repeat protein
VTYKVALARYRSGNLDGALAALATALRLNDRMPDAYYLQGLCLRDARRPADAQRALEKAVSIAPGMIAAREELADLYGSQRDRADELEQLQVLAGLDRDRIERQVAIGIAHARWAADTRETASRRAVHTDLAVLTLGSALERAPDDMQLHTALGRVWLDVGLARNDRGALGKAVEALESVGSADTGVTSDALTVYGRALLESGRTDLAERILQRATGRYPVESSAFAYYAAAAEQQRHWEAARTALVRYDALVPAGQDLAVRAGRIAALSNRLGDFATAVEWLERAVAGSPNDADLLGSLADAQFRNGDPAAAAATLKRALDKDPQNPDLLALQRKVR